MEVVSAKIKVLNDLSGDLYKIENTETHDILTKVHSKIRTMLDVLYKEQHKLVVAERPNILKKMIELLKIVDESDLPDNYDGFITNNEINNLACDCLIDSNGRCIWENHDVLREAGFQVFPGEQDRFGWLTGCIQTKKGIIVYG
jgi:hypothetical protein